MVTASRGSHEGREGRKKNVWKNKGIGRECVVLQYPFKPEESSSLEREGGPRDHQSGRMFSMPVPPSVREIFTNIRGLGNKGLPVSILFFFPPGVRTSIIILEYKFQDLVVPRPWMNHPFHLQFIEIARLK